MSPSNELIFRFDNSPHHHGAHYPHHKHVGNQIEGRPEPQVGETIDDIRRHLYPDTPPAAP